MVDRRGGYWQQTFTGRYFWPADPRMEDVCIEDIAHQLAMNSRWNGATTRYYCVAEHSVHVSHMVPSYAALHGLLHDGSEAYLPDLIRPIKHHPEMHPVFKKFEDPIQAVIWDRFGLSRDVPDCVGVTDLRLVGDEVQLLANPHLDDTLPGNDVVGYGLDLSTELDWRAAKELFLCRFHELYGGD